MPSYRGSLLFVSMFAVWAASVLILGCGADRNAPCGLETPKGALRVTSIPPGASIVLDGHPTGATTDTILSGLSPGRHVVRVDLPGCTSSPDSLMAEVTAEDTALAPFTLALAATGRIAVSSEPAGASIVLDGSEMGLLTPDTLVGVAIGEHTVRVSLAGYAAEPESARVPVVEDSISTAVFSLVETGTGRIAVISNPPGADVLLDGAATGTSTPDTLDWIAPGAHVVRVSLLGYSSEPESVIVEVAVDSVSAASFELDAVAAERLVLIEHFTSESCPNCPLVEANMELAIEDLGFAKVVSIGNHLNWPAPNDPFYLANAAQENQRRARFNVVTMPHLRINGMFFEDAASYEALLPALQAATESPPSFVINVHAETTIDSFIISGTVKKTEATPAGDEVLIAVIIETGIQFDATNGADHYDDVVRRFLPGTTGEPFTEAVGVVVPYRFAEALSTGWNTDNLEAVVFLESSSTKKVFQAGSTRTLGKPHGPERKDGRR